MELITIAARAITSSFLFDGWEVDIDLFALDGFMIFIPFLLNVKPEARNIYSEPLCYEIKPVPVQRIQSLRNLELLSSNQTLV